MTGYNYDIKSVYYIKFAYNDLGLPVSIEKYEQDGILKLRKVHEYDKQGLLTKLTKFDDIKKTTSITRYSYEFNSDGSLAKGYYWEEGKEKQKYTECYEYGRKNWFV